MRYKHTGKANISISELSVGTWAIGGVQYGKVDEQESISAMRTMFDAGVNLVDTAPYYGSGHSETVVGKALADGYRQKVLIATKFSIYNDAEGNTVHDGSYKNVIEECEASLKRLNTDYIDIYIMHWPDPKTPIEETMSALNELKKAGKIRFIGVSNFDQELIERAEKTACIEFLQPPYSMVNESQKSLLQWCEMQGIGTMTYGSLGSGILTGAIRSKPDWDEDDFRYTFYDFYREPKFSKVLSLLNTLDVIAASHNIPLAQLAINWSTQKSYVSTAICGVRNPEEALENCKAFDWELTSDEIYKIDAKLEDLKL
jgi:aryl-alcohol dehydrogenase-like predicted oxidoreductase